MGAAREAGDALAYHAGGLGDFVLSLPALVRLARSRPGVRWHYWGPRERLVLLPGWQPAPAEVLRAEASLWGGRPRIGAARWLAAADLLVAFAAQPPPWVPAAPRGLPVQAFPADLTPPPVRVPVFQARQLDGVGIPRLPGPWLPEWRRRVLPERPGGWLLLHPGSGDRAKNLPLETWRQALDLLCREFRLEPRVLEGPVERERGTGEAGRGAKRVACATLGELLSALGRASLVLANDSGVAHLAGLLGIPTVVAFGPSHPGVWRPLGPRVAVAASPRGCAPCCAVPPVCCAELACLDEVTAPALADAGRRVMDLGFPGGGQETVPKRR